MERIYSEPSPILIHHLKDILEEKGIPTIIKNEFLSGGVGELPPTEVWPELWVVDKEDGDAAQKIVQDFIQSTKRPFWGLGLCGMRRACGRPVQGVLELRGSTGDRLGRQGTGQAAWNENPRTSLSYRETCPAGVPVDVVGFYRRMERHRGAPAVRQPGRADVCRRGPFRSPHLHTATCQRLGIRGQLSFFWMCSMRGSPVSRILTCTASGTRISVVGKLSGRKISFGPVSDIGFLLGLNWARDSEVMKYLPGVRLSLDIEGFAFANLDIMAYIDDSNGLSSGGAPEEDDSFLVDFNFARPFSVGAYQFSIEGHIEYAGSRDNELGRPGRILGAGPAAASLACKRPCLDGN